MMFQPLGDIPLTLPHKHSIWTFDHFPSLDREDKVCVRGTAIGATKRLEVYGYGSTPTLALADAMSKMKKQEIDDMSGMFRSDDGLMPWSR